MAILYSVLLPPSSFLIIRLIMIAVWIYTTHNVQGLTHLVLIVLKDFRFRPFLPQPFHRNYPDAYYASTFSATQSNCFQNLSPRHLRRGGWLILATTVTLIFFGDCFSYLPLSMSGGNGLYILLLRLSCAAIFSSDAQSKGISLCALFLGYFDNSRLAFHTALGVGYYLLMRWL